MSCLFILLFMMQNIIHQKIIKYIIRNSGFLFLWGFKMQMKMSFMALEIWLHDFVIRNHFISNPVLGLEKGFLFTKYVYLDLEIC